MKKKISYIALLTLVCIVACKKGILVSNISNKTITVNAPADNLKTPVSKVTFWWEAVEGADKYNVQVVKPSFTNVAQLVVDTNLTLTKWNITLQPGIYQWRIRAINSGYSTAYQTYNLTIDSSDVLTGQDVVPVEPISGFVTRNKAVTFSWLPISSATSYSIEISLGSSIVNYSVVSSSPYTYTFSVSTASNYAASWRIKAMNASTVSQYNTPQTFTIDLASPAVSTPTAPANNAVVRDTVELRWNRPGAPDTYYDSLFIYSDAAFANLIRSTSVTAAKVKISDISPGAPLPAGTGSASAVSYWWRLKAVDKAGNTSGYSSAFSFQLIN
jgi:hypothetical protein